MYETERPTKRPLPPQRGGEGYRGVLADPGCCRRSVENELIFPPRGSPDRDDEPEGAQSVFGPARTAAWPYILIGLSWFDLSGTLSDEWAARIHHSTVRTRDPRANISKQNLC